MKLNQADILQNYRITSVQEQEKIQRRLEALGILEGTKVVVLNRKRNGSTIIKVREGADGRLAMRSRKG